MIKFYKYLFYRIYQWQLYWWGKKWDPEITASWATSLVISLNIYFVAGLGWFVLFKKKFPLLQSKIIVVFTVIAIEFLVLHFFNEKSKFKQIEKLFLNKQNSVFFDAIVLTVYYVLSIVALASLVLIHSSSI